MSNIFANLQKYAENWAVVDKRNFSVEEANQVANNVVVKSERAEAEGYGMSVCFFMKGGGQTYIPLSRDSKLGVGESIDLATAQILTLERDGKTICRIQEQ